MSCALVTGAAKRIGRSIALHLARNGWDIGLHFRSSRKEAETLAQEIRTLERQAFLVQADFEKPEDVESLFSKIPAPVAALVNNASLFERDDADPSGLRHRQINVGAPLRLTELFAARLPPETEGSVVHILDATTLSLVFSSYAQSRASFERDWPVQALSLLPRVRINALALGPTLRAARESEEHFAALVRATPHGRAINPEEVAQAVLFLLSVPSLTGQTLFLDGGAYFKKILLHATH